MSSLTKQQQSKMANGVVKRLEKRYPEIDSRIIDFHAEIRLIDTHPTQPWEYPWAEVLRWCREQKR